MGLSLRGNATPRETALFVVSSTLGASFIFLTLLRHDNVLSPASKAILFASLELTFLLVGKAVSLRFKDIVKAGLFATAALLLVAGFDDFRSAVVELAPSVGRLRYLVPFYVLMMVAVLLFVGRARRGVKIVTVCLDGVLVAAAVYMVVGLATSPMVVDEQEDGASSRSGFDRVTLSYRPDVYYLILDSYTSSESLKKYWGYDNSGFERQLEGLGFVVARESRAFYQATQISMDSTLNMSSDESLRRRTLRESLAALKSNETTLRFEELGYDIVNLSPFDLGRGAKPFYGYLFKSPILGTIGDAATKLAGDSLPGAFAEGIGYYQQDVAEKNMEIFSRIAEVKKGRNGKPFFMYAHVITPHPPNTLYPDGRLIPSRTRTPMNETSYLDQIKGTNVNALKAVRSLLSSYPDDQKPIVMLQGDHGYRNLESEENRENERLTILNAYHLPAGGNENVYQSIPPYRTFEMIFETYF